MQSFLSFDPFFLSDFLSLMGSSFYSTSNTLFALPETNLPYQVVRRKEIHNFKHWRQRVIAKDFSCWNISKLEWSEPFIDFESMERQADPKSKRLEKVTRWWWWWKSHRIQMNALFPWDETFLGQKLSFSFMFIVSRSEWVHIVPSPSSKPKLSHFQVAG